MGCTYGSCDRIFHVPCVVKDMAGVLRVVNGGAGCFFFWV